MAPSKPTSWSCLVCGKTFMVGEWVCADGTSNHIVEEKIYRTLDAPLEPGRPVDGSQPPVVRGKTIVCNIPPAKKTMVDGEVRMMGEGSVEFINGVFSTKDPEIQYWLNKKDSCHASQEDWDRVWKTAEERLADKEAKLRAAEQRLENERNELLVAVKQQKKQAEKHAS